MWLVFNILVPQIIYQLIFWLVWNKGDRMSIGEFIKTILFLFIPFMNYIYISTIIMVELENSGNFDKSKELNRKIYSKIKNFLNKQL